MNGRGDRRGRLLLAAGCAAALPALAGCGIQATGITPLGAAPAAAQGSAPAGGGVISAGENQYLLFFYQNNRLVPVYRPANGPAGEKLVLAQLLLGPNAQEKAAGYTSALPAKLVATPNAEQERYAFALSAPLGSRGRTEFICTMQYVDGTDSIGVEIAGLPQTMIWTGCADTTNQYVPMQMASPQPSDTAAVAQ